MKKIFQTITAFTLAIVMMSIVPMADLARGTLATAAAKSEDTAEQPLYISDIKIGNAYTDGDADPDKGMLNEADTAAKLMSEGYTILMDGGSYADLNEGAGSKSGLKIGPNHKKILLGYKTTTNANEAITDLTVMNMRGGYDPDDYQTLLKQKMDSEIRPFVERFIETIKEYRANYKMDKNSVNHKRADAVRKLLNKFTDDDTGDKPIGDLILNDTKFEMGDAAYNKLSASEKKNHADILTMVLQGNSQVILAIETFLSRATDTSTEDTWLDRLSGIELSTLVEEEKAANPKLTTRSDVYRELDKKYNDLAKQLQIKFEDAMPLFKEADNYEEEALESSGERNVEELADAPDAIKDGDDLVDAYAAAAENKEAYNDTVNDNKKLQIAVLAAYLQSIQYGDGTMYDFFCGESSKTDDGVRAMYPIVEALTDGQKAGLQFLSMIDLIAICVDDGDWFDKTNADDYDTVSVYMDVNREIYQPGGVALTSKARRSGLTVVEEGEPWDPKNISWYTWTLWGLTAIGVGGSIFTKVMATKTMSKILTRTKEINDTVAQNFSAIEKMSAKIKECDSMIQQYSQLAEQPTEIGQKAADFIESKVESIQRYVDGMELLEKDNADLQAELAGMASDTTYRTLSYIFIGATIALLVFSTVSTLVDISKAYNTVFLPIPKYMVDEADITEKTDDGVRLITDNQKVFYKAVTCTRVKGDSSIEEENYKTMLDRNDLNGDVGRQWLCLYALKNDKGYPILADSLRFQKGSSSAPEGYSTGIHEFDGAAATNLNNKTYLFRDDAPSIYVFYKNAEKTVTQLMSGAAAEEVAERDVKKDLSANVAVSVSGMAVSGAAGSLFGGGGITASGVALGGGIGIVLGGLLGALFMFLARRKKHPGKPE